MLRVVKRDGRIIDFKKSNVMTSVANSARDSNIQLTEKELELIAKSVEKTIKEVRGEDGVTSTYEIRGVVVRALKEMGYKNVAKDFYEGEKIRRKEHMEEVLEDEQEIEERESWTDDY
jgi:transcriptional regulator NrdR family protein